MSVEYIGSNNWPRLVARDRKGEVIFTAIPYSLCDSQGMIYVHEEN